MQSTDKIMECVANISHGRHDDKLKRVIDAVRTVPGQKLLDIDISPSANRSVFTFAGSPGAVYEAAFNLIEQTAKIVDMRYHQGGHPRIGATDVCPFVPLRHCSSREAVQLSIDLARRVGAGLNIPVYLYERSARYSYRKALPQIRKGGYEKLPEKMLSPKWKPDFGPGFTIESREQILKTGATVIGVRPILVAFNISLSTSSTAIAKKIAYRLRTIGWPRRERLGGRDDNEPAFQYPALRAIGWYSKDYACAQVSFNFLRYRKTSPLTIWEKVKELAEEYNATATGCEVIGLIPQSCIMEAGYFAAARIDPCEIYSDDELMRLGAEHFRFNHVRPFNLREKILEYRLQEL